MIKNFAIVIICLLSIMLFVILLVTQPIFAKHPQIWQATVDENQLKKHVKILSNQLPERSEDVDKLNESANYIHQQLDQYTDNIQYQKYSVWGIEYQNVIAHFGPAYTDALYVVGAHYDSFDGLPGADDNASGVAGLIELAKLMAEKPPPIAVQLVAYALEEPPYFGTVDMGSYHHAKYLNNHSINLTLMVSLEMIGYFTDQQNSQQYPLESMKRVYSTQGNFIAIVGGVSEVLITRQLKKSMIIATPLPVLSMNAPPLVTGVNFSDHLNYWQFDYSAIMITDTAFYRNKNYHTAKDTWEKLDYQRMAMVVQGLYHALITHMRN